MFVGYFSCLVALGGSGIDSSTLEGVNEMGRLESALSCSCAAVCFQSLPQLYFGS